MPVLGTPTEVTLRRSPIIRDGTIAISFTGSITLPLMRVAMAPFFLTLIQFVVRRQKRGFAPR